MAILRLDLFAIILKSMNQQLKNKLLAIFDLMKRMDGSDHDLRADMNRKIEKNGLCPRDYNLHYLLLSSKGVL